MDLRQLRYLVALAEERNFTRAAARELIAQPALSQQIRRLERELGLALVERTTRHVAVTEAGELLVSRARRALAEVEAAQARDAGAARPPDRTSRDRRDANDGPDRPLAGDGDLPRRHPGVELVVREQSSEELAEMLRVDELDLAFLSVTERIESHGLGLAQLASEELVVVLPRDHRLGGAARVRMAELAGEQFIGYRKGARLRELLESAARQSGFDPYVKLASNEGQRIRRLIACGVGIAIMPRSEAAGPGASSPSRCSWSPGCDATSRSLGARDAAWPPRRPRS